MISFTERGKSNECITAEEDAYSYFAWLQCAAKRDNKNWLIIKKMVWWLLSLKMGSTDPCSENGSIFIYWQAESDIKGSLCGCIKRIVKSALLWGVLVLLYKKETLTAFLQTVCDVIFFLFWKDN